GGRRVHAPKRDHAPPPRDRLRAALAGGVALALPVARPRRPALDAARAGGGRAPRAARDTAARARARGRARPRDAAGAARRRRRPLGLRGVAAGSLPGARAAADRAPRRL